MKMIAFLGLLLFSALFLFPAVTAERKGDSFPCEYEEEVLDFENAGEVIAR